MQGLILAAGRGSRLGDITEFHPKGLTLLVDHPLIEWQINAMTEAGVLSICACTGYLAEQIVPYVDKTFYNDIWHSSNMVRSLLAADLHLSSGSTIISYSDIIYSGNSVEKLIATPGDIVIAYDPNWLQQWQIRFDNPLEDAESFKLNGLGQLIEIGLQADNVSEIMGQYLGLIKVTPNGWKLITNYLKQISLGEINKLDMTTLLNRLIAQGVRLDVCAIEHNWFEIDNAKDLALCESLITDFNWQAEF